MYEEFLSLPLCQSLDRKKFTFIWQYCSSSQNFTVVFVVGGRCGPTSSLVSDLQKKAEKSLS